MSLVEDIIAAAENCMLLYSDIEKIPRKTFFYKALKIYPALPCTIMSSKKATDRQPINSPMIFSAGAIFLRK